MANTRFNGLSFARQGLQVATLVIVPVVLVSLLIGVLLLLPTITHIEWLFWVITMAAIFAIAGLTLLAYFRWAVVPCVVEVGDNKIIINLKKRTLFYPYKIKEILLGNVRNAACNTDNQAGKDYISITTRSPYKTYTLQYVDGSGNDTTHNVWQEIEAMLIEYNGDSRHQQITSINLLQRGFIKVLLFITGGFFIAFTIALIIDPSYRTWDRVPTYIIFGLLFFGLLGAMYKAKNRNNT
ncbi:MAG: hypothetical protein M0D57_16735 [Sphingobacteriales bacterium JAD_PAG50586_3]|nr:MAG: hypothetical protein M0D57_16735 [Sphingobacteriales bacterium JAD_PAG50586_3]